jgi:Domain of unknown function (DUF4136)
MNQPQRNLRRISVFFGLAMATITLGACASQPTQPHTMRDPQANFASFKTFGWDVTQSAQGNGQPVSIVDSNIRAAITSELKRKGYEEASSGALPDLFLQYETGKAEMVKSNPFRIGVGVGSYGNSGGVGVGTSSAATRNVTEGMLVLRVIDPTRQAEVWNGRVSRELGKAGTPDPALIQSAVGDLLSDFPAHGAPPQ